MIQGAERGQEAQHAAAVVSLRGHRISSHDEVRKGCERSQVRDLVRWRRWEKASAMSVVQGCMLLYTAEATASGAVRVSFADVTCRARGASSYDGKRTQPKPLRSL